MPVGCRFDDINLRLYRRSLSRLSRIETQNIPGAGVPRSGRVSNVAEAVELVLGKTNRHAPRTPLPRRPIEYAGAGSATGATVPLICQLPIGEHVPVAADERFSAAMAEGAAARLVMHVSRIGIAQTILDGDPARVR